jgi:hypothetical protein
MWRLPTRARKGINEMGVENLLKDSLFGATTVHVWLHEQDIHDWSVKMISYTTRGPTNTEPALTELRGSSLGCIKAGQLP